jgi:hypothetical protein
MAVVVGDELTERGEQVALAMDEGVVQALAAGGADPPFRVCVRPWRLGWGAHDPHAFGGEDGVEGAAVLRVAVAEEELNRATRSPSSMTRSRACRVTHSPVGFGLAPSRCTLPVAIWMTNRT